MKRTQEIEKCKELVFNEGVDHLHIRRKAVVTGFTDDLLSDLADDSRVLSVRLSDWESEAVMSDLRWRLQKELSRRDYWLSKLRAVGGNITLFGFGIGADAEWEENPDHSRVRDYLREIASQTDGQVVVFIDYHGERPVDGFGWIPKLLPLPENSTLLTDGFQRCALSDSEEVEVGRFSEAETVEYLTNVRADLSEEDTREIHRIHDGNPVAIEMALESGNLTEPLTGNQLDALWEEVYDEKITGDKYDLLEGSAHLVDLDSRDVAMVVGKTRGECREILLDLETEGVVTKKKAGLFTTDKYVKRYISRRLSDGEIAENHRESFATYAERWIESYEAQMQELEADDEEVDVNQFFHESVEHGYTDPDLYLAIHHLSKAHDQLDIDTFIEELAGLGAAKSGVFTFGVIAQRFFFENPMEVIAEMSESILGIEEEIKSEIFSGSLDVIFGFDLHEYVTELSKGWTGEINTEKLEPYNMSNPDEKVEWLQRNYSADAYQDLPPEVQTAIVRLMLLVYTDTRRAREYYRQFGATAEKYGLYEEPFGEFLDDLADLIEVLRPDGTADAGGRTGLRPASRA